MGGAKDPVIVSVPAAPPPIIVEKPGAGARRDRGGAAGGGRADGAPAPTLDILSRPPGARVTVDGEALRTADAHPRRAFASGMHKVLVEKKGYTPRELAVQLGDGEHRTLDVELRPAAQAVVRMAQGAAGLSDRARRCRGPRCSRARG